MLFSLQILKDSKHWFVDGTFKPTPSIFYQTYVIMAKQFGGVHPVIYALLPNKQQATYARMIGLVKDLQPGASPEKISCDFELGAINAFKEAFPNAELLGCFFHLVKNMKKHLAHMNLLSRYNTDADFSLQARMVTSLAFVPEGDLDDAIDHLFDELPNELHPLLEWFEDSYLGRPQRRGRRRRNALFPPTLWSVYNRVLDGTDRTNNHAEAAHRRLQNEMSMDHPTIWKYIDALKKIQSGRDLYYEQLLSGQQPPTKLKKYRDCDERIILIVRDYRNRNITEYLRAISHNYVMNA